MKGAHVEAVRADTKAAFRTDTKGSQNGSNRLLGKRTEPLSPNLKPGLAGHLGQQNQSHNNPQGSVGDFQNGRRRPGTTGGDECEPRFGQGTSILKHPQGNCRVFGEAL